MIKDGTIYRLYSPGCAEKPDGLFDATTEATCYAEGNNTLLAPHPHHVSHNFSPLLDDRSSVLTAERCEAVCGIQRAVRARTPGAKAGDMAVGLFRYVPADGLHWKSFSSEPLFATLPRGSLCCLPWLPNAAIVLAKPSSDLGMEVDGARCM